MKPFVVGITGCSGSGKTYFLKKLVEKLHEGRVAVLTMDNYYKPIDEQVRDENNVVHFDLPTSIDEEKFQHDLEQLIRNKAVTITEYTFNVHDREPQKIIVRPAPIIIAEGIFTFLYQGVNALLDYRIFVDAPEELMLERRIKRDEAERGYHDRSVRYRFDNHVLPIYRAQVLPTKDTADFVVKNDGDLEMDLVHVTAFLGEKLV